MNEFLNFFLKHQVNLTQTIFCMLFSCGIAIFHTFIINGLFRIDLKPKWLFFVLNPAIVGIAYFVNSGYVFPAILILFASVFVFAIIGMIYSIIRDSKLDQIEKKIFNARYNIPEKSVFQKLAGIITFIAIICLWNWLASIEKLSLLLIIIPLLIILNVIFFPSRKSKFYKLQAVLPSSKMNAIAMGLVEVIGDVIETKPILSPHFNNPCIGYWLKIEESSKDKDGKETWSTIFTDAKTGSFQIKDETGIVTVDGEGLEFYTSKVDKEIESGKKRYSETYLKNDDYIQLIGYASSDNGNTVIRKDDHHKVFGAALPHEVALRNKFAPLLTSFLFTLFVITLVIIYIIIN